jgi:hypothetical protein
MTWMECWTASQAKVSWLIPKRETYEFGKFGWFTDPAGNGVELWQPIATE